MSSPTHDCVCVFVYMSLFMHVCACTCVCACVTVYVHVSGGIRTPRAGVTSGCEPVDQDPGKQTRVL